MQSQKVLDQEINQLQNRYMRCAQACQDDAQDLMRGGTTVRAHGGKAAPSATAVSPLLRAVYSSQQRLYPDFGFTGFSRFSLLPPLPHP